MSGHVAMTDLGGEDGFSDIRSNKFGEDIVRDKYGQTIQRTSLQRFYSGASVLVTGATGFMGKVLIEKLLRSCPDIETIYMMVREKKGRSLDERIDDLVSSPCFDRIKKEVPEYRCKLKAVAGDIGYEGLGISEEDIHLLQRQVDIVFHVAATVRFDEHLKLAILQNVRGTRELLELCKTFRKLKAVVHVSTAYSNCPRSEIDECFYDAPISGDQAIYMAETLDILTIDYLSHKLMDKWPNTYAFTKALSEDVVKKYGQGMPVGMFRPSVVVSTRSEPMVGWIDNMYGATGVIVGVASGLIRTMQADRPSEANIVPCDMVINAMIVSAWDVTENRTSKEIPVYNYVSPRENRLAWSEFNRLYLANGLELSSTRAIWYWTLTICSNRLVYLIHRLLLHDLPAVLTDLYFLAANKKTQMMRIYKKTHRFLDVIAYFSTKQWTFRDGNVVELWRKLSPVDQETFYFDMRSLNWETYIKDSCPGLRQYLMKDPLDTLPAAKVKMQRLYILHRLTQTLALCFVLWLTTRALSVIVARYSTVPPEGCS